MRRVICRLFPLQICELLPWRQTKKWVYAMIMTEKESEVMQHE